MHYIYLLFKYMWVKIVFFLIRPLVLIFHIIFILGLLIILIFQVDLSDSEAEDSETPLDNKEDAMGRRRAGDLSVNKKGTPLYSREDIREQYCINDKELQVLDKSGRRSILGCFSNNGQVNINFHNSFSKVLYSCVGQIVYLLHKADLCQEIHK